MCEIDREECALFEYLSVNEQVRERARVSECSVSL